MAKEKESFYERFNKYVKERFGGFKEFYKDNHRIRNKIANIGCWDDHFDILAEDIEYRYNRKYESLLFGECGKPRIILIRPVGSKLVDAILNERAGVGSGWDVRKYGPIKIFETTDLIFERICRGLRTDLYIHRWENIRKDGAPKEGLPLDDPLERYY